MNKEFKKYFKDELGINFDTATKSPLVLKNELKVFGLSGFEASITKGTSIKITNCVDYISSISLSLVYLEIEAPQLLIKRVSIYTKLNILIQALKEEV